MTTATEEKARELTPEQIAEKMTLPVSVVKKMLHPKGRTELTFDERDVDRRWGRKNIRLVYSEKTAAGFARPRTVPRKEASR